MKRRWLFITLALVLVVAVGASSFFVVRRLQRARSAGSTTVMVGPNGGRFTISGVTLTVPRGAVSGPTELDVTTPVRVGQQATSPLGAHAKGRVQFNVRLSGGRVQPRRPLRFEMPLTGVLLPDGVRPEQALVYTETKERRGYELIPTRLDKSGVLHGEFRHLTLMDLVFVDLPKFMRHLGDQLVVPGIGRSRPDSCRLEISSTDVGKVRIGQPLGWSRGRTSTIHPCLEEHSGVLRLKIINNSLIYWQVGTKEGTTLQVERDETAAVMITKFARMLGADPGTQEYLHRGGELFVNIPSDALPSRTALKASYGTFHAEALWLAMNALVSITLGTEIPPSIHYAADLMQRVLEPLLKVVGVVDCLRDAVNLSRQQTGMEALITLFDFFTSTCGEKISEVLTRLVGGSVASGAFWRSKLGVLAVVKQAGDTLIGGFTNAYQQAYPPVVVTVDRVEEPVSQPPSQDGCLTPQQFVGAMRRIPGYFPEPIEPGTEVVCEDYEAASRVRLSGGLAYVLLVKSHGGWNGTNFNGQGLRPREECATLPPKIRAYLKDACA